MANPSRGLKRPVKIRSARLHGPKEQAPQRRLPSRLGVSDRELLVLVVAVGKRESNDAYKAADRRKTG